VLAHSEDRIVLAEEEEALRRPPFVLGVELCFEELLLQDPSLSIGDTSEIPIGVGLSVSREWEDTYPRLVYLDILEVIGGLEICRQEGRDLCVRRSVMGEMRQEGQLRTLRETGQETLDILDRLVARVRTLVAESVDDQELGATDLSPLLQLDGLHVRDVAQRSDPIADDG